MTALTFTLQAPAAPATLPARPPVDIRAHEAVLDVVVPVYNEETDLPRCVRRLHAHLTRAFPYSFRITVADNASTDRTSPSRTSSPTSCRVSASVHLPQKGRGRALAAVWSASDAPVLAYMDVDLSTDLGGLLPLVAPLISGHSDVAIGSRLARGARVVRGPKREFISRSYNSSCDRAGVRFSDAQCGFKAVRARRRAATAAAGRGHRLVLRHRAAGAGRAGGPADPRGARRLGGRPGQPRRHRRHRGRRPQGRRPRARRPGERPDPGRPGSAPASAGRSR